jgi:arylsulfatase A-like enzyme
MGGLSLPVSVTYANHAALITGVDPTTTGIHGNQTWIDGRGWVPAPAKGPLATTLFDRVAAAGGRSVMIAGDQKLVAQMGGERADRVWPPGGRLPEGTDRCLFGYASDAAVLDALASCDLDADLAVIHLNEPDTTSHLHGPDSPEAIEQYRTTDAAYGKVIDQLAEGWDDTIVLTLSDHDQEPITDFTPVELRTALDGVGGVDVTEEGTAALLHISPDTALPDRPDDHRHGAPEIDLPADAQLREMIRAVPGVEAAIPLAPDVWMAWTEPGRVFGTTPIPIHGQHGSPRCRTQMAIVSGGHERVASLARHVERHQPAVLDWAPTTAALLDLDGTTG